MVKKLIAQSVLEQAAKAGRKGDSIIGHLTRGDLVIPAGMVTPELTKALKTALGLDIARYTAGNKANQLNPKTKLPEFYETDGNAGGIETGTQNTGVGTGLSGIDGGFGFGFGDYGGNIAAGWGGGVSGGNDGSGSNGGTDKGNEIMPPANPLFPQPPALPMPTVRQWTPNWAAPRLGQDGFSDATQQQNTMVANNGVNVTAQGTGGQPVGITFQDWYSNPLFANFRGGNSGVYGR